MARAKKAKKELEEEVETPVFHETETFEDDGEEEIEHYSDPDQRFLSIDEIKALENGQEWDIFDDVGLSRIKAGDKVKFLIKKDGEMLPSLDWFQGIGYDYLAKKHGGGMYNIKCRSSQLGRIIKVQTESLAAPVVEDEEEVVEPNQPATSQSDLFMMIQQMDKSAKEERRLELERLRQEQKEKLEESKTASNQIMNAVTTLVAALQPKDNSAMLMQMMQIQMESNKAIAASQAESQRQTMEMIHRSQEQSNKRMEDLIAGLSKKKDDGPSAIELMNMQAAAEDRGFAKAQQIFELAEEKAEEIAEMRAAQEGGEQKDSLAASVLKGVLPILAQSPAPGNLNTMSPPKTVSVPSTLQAQKTIAVKPPQRRETPKVVKQPVGRVNVNGDRKKYISDVVVKVIGEKLLAQDHDPVSGADEALKRLAPSGILAKDLYSQFTLQDMIKTAGELGMPAAINPYLEGFYAHIATKAGASSGKPAAAESQPSITQ